MGACFSSSPGEPPKKSVSKTPSAPFPITVAFPNIAPHTLTINPNDKIAKIRSECMEEMKRRHADGLDFVRVEGKLTTLNPDTGEANELADAMSVKESNLEEKQYLWFHDKSETSRVDDLILRSSRLNENRSHNSRGVKQGMAMLKSEEAPATSVRA